MATRQWAWKDGWTHGGTVGFIPYTWFCKDETGLLNKPSETLFFQSWGLDTDLRAAYMPPKPKKAPYFSEDYDLRWRWTTVFYPSRVGNPHACPLSWEEIKKLERKSRQAEDKVLEQCKEADHEELPGDPQAAGPLHGQA